MESEPEFDVPPAYTVDTDSDHMAVSTEPEDELDNFVANGEDHSDKDYVNSDDHKDQEGSHSISENAIPNDDGADNEAEIPGRLHRILEFWCQDQG
jgi:hypothetical protein